MIKGGRAELANFSSAGQMGEGSLFSPELQKERKISFAPGHMRYSAHVIIKWPELDR